MILRIATATPIAVASARRVMTPVSTRVAVAARDLAQSLETRDVASNDPYNGYSREPTEFGIAFIVPRYESAGLLLLRFTGLAFVVTFFLGAVSDIFLDMALSIAGWGLFCAVLTAGVVRNMPEHGSRIEVRPDGLVLNGASFFQRQDIRGISFLQYEGKETRYLQIIYGVTPIILAEQMEPITSRVFEADFNAAQRRLWLMRD